ncbi:DsrE family protein [Shewanella sp. FJAT-52076]|uniref:DsrE family protein n=1 Tax=Shewanella sp. FJAT-52076 TaxID=2864202 RepID=UPI001C66021C|nr:DsrE family protein [Shewanella sp. FJAT-52076]QYJ76925.1 DsrE family protein [Shewanella sp. FJAT-52076]
MTPVSKVMTGSSWITSLTLAAVLGLALPSANANEFRSGPVIQGYGEVANRVKQTYPIPKDQHFKVVFDLAAQSEEGKINRTIDSLARFINMHAAAGVDPNNIQLALVVHGKAVFDVLSDDAHFKKLARGNAQAKLLKALMDNGVRVMVCGQTAAYLGVDNNMLLPGVEMSLSAMSAHAILAQQGYSQNPF